MSEKIVCPFCGTKNEADRVTCTNCRTNFRQADLFKTLGQRLARLETMVIHLQREFSTRPAEPPPPEPLLETAVPQPTPPPPVRLPSAEWSPRPQSTKVPLKIPTGPPEPPASSPPRSYLPESVWQSDIWFNKIGLGLLLLALAFLYNHAVDQGWIGPWGRLSVGLVLASSFLGIGYKTVAKRPHFGQALQGGGIAAYYITGFAAFRVYEVVSFPVAFGFMLLVTALAFTLSLDQKEAMLSLIGGLGGLATPFLLNTGQGNYVGLIIYTCLICGSLVLIYFFQGWQILLWLANLGGWGIFFGAMHSAGLQNSIRPNAENLTLQVGILFGLIMFWAMPVLRHLDWLEDPKRLPPIKFGIADSYLAQMGKLPFKAHPQLTILLNPLIALWFTWALWGLTDVSEGLITLGTACLFGVVAAGLVAKPRQSSVAYMHGLTAVLFFNIALFQLLDGSWLLLALALEAVVLHWGTRFIKFIPLQIGAHTLSLIVVSLLAARFIEVPMDSTAVPILNLDSITDLIVIVLLFVVAYSLQAAKQSEAQIAYWITAHMGMLLWWQREIQQFDLPGLVLLGWAVHAMWFHWDAQWQEYIWVRTLPHLLSVVVIFWLFAQMFFDRPATAVLSLQSFFNLATIGIIFATSYNFADVEEIYLSIGHRIIAHVALLTWFWQEFSLLSGQGLVTIAWGIYAVILLGIALYLRNQLLRLVALATLFTLVGKLFLVDLISVETVWRILLFAGFGSLFLFISYFYRSWLGLPEQFE